jgi:Domain of unknown function (DUF5666)
MAGRTAQSPAIHDQTGLPRPRRGARWRWSRARSREAMAAGGVLAAVLGLGVPTSAGAGAATASTTSGHSGATAHGAPPGGMTRPTVSGKITALSGDDIAVETKAKSSVTVVYSSSTTFKTSPGSSGGTTSSASALKVGAFVGITGTKNSDGSVTATAVVIGRPDQMSQGGRGGKGGAPKGGKPPSGAGAPSA